MFVFEDDAAVRFPHFAKHAVSRLLLQVEHRNVMMFAGLKPAEQEGVRDIADIVKAEAEKPEPDVGKLKRWGGRLVDLTADVGLKVVSGTIAGLLLKMYGGG
jgi:hypothetical protein